MELKRKPPRGPASVSKRLAQIGEELEATPMPESVRRLYLQAHKREVQDAILPAELYEDYESDLATILMGVGR